ncbi:MAG: hypothetical protein R3309_10030 [Reinekea sp.]|nr:hypothetical protein [Reinekea sp.]
MQVENLAKKRFFIQCGESKFDLRPASGIVTLPEGADVGYINALEKAGNVKVHSRDEVKIEDAVIVSDEPSERELLEAEYLALANDEADGRWSDETLKEKIAALSE